MPLNGRQALCRLGLNTVVAAPPARKQTYGVGDTETGHTLERVLVQTAGEPTFPPFTFALTWQRRALTLELTLIRPRQVKRECLIEIVGAHHDALFLGIRDEGEDCVCYGRGQATMTWTETEYRVCLALPPDVLPKSFLLERSEPLLLIVSWWDIAQAPRFFPVDPVLLVPLKITLPARK